MSENFAKWKTALLSGEYAQTQDALRDSKGFCCLGVACDVFMKETGRGHWKEYGSGTITFVLDGGEYEGEPPEEVMQYFGFDRAVPLVKYRNHDVAVTYLNDGGTLPYSAGAGTARKHTFDKLAGKLEKSLTGK